MPLLTTPSFKFLIWYNWYYQCDGSTKSWGGDDDVITSAPLRMRTPAECNLT
jgi:hypothetical protein